MLHTWQNHAVIEQTQQRQQQCREAQCWDASNAASGLDQDSTHCSVARDKASNIATTLVQMDCHTTGTVSHSIIKATERART